MKNTRKILSVILSIVMIISLLPLSAFESFADTIITSQDGEWKYTLDGNNAVIADYLGSDTALDIPDEVDGYTVTEIGSHAFENRDFESVVFPDTLRYIDEYAFAGCNDLESITLPSKIKGIGQYAFYDCFYLYDITIPNKTVSLGDYCFGFMDDGQGNSEKIGVDFKIPAESTAYDYCDYFGFSSQRYTIMEMQSYVDYTDIEDGDTESVLFTEDDNTVYFRFVPEKSGVYVFESLYDGNQTDPCVLVYDEDGYLLTSDDNGANDAYENFRIEYSFTAGEEYFLCCSQTGIGAYGYDVALNRVSAASGYTEIALDTLTSAAIENGGDYAYFRFTPSVTGTYYFESFDNSSDTVGYIFDDSIVNPNRYSSSKIAEDDDSGNSSNFKVESTLYAGYTYILAGRYYNTSYTGSFDVKLYKAPSATAIEFADGSAVQGYVGFTKTLNLSFLPAGASSEFIEFVSSDDGVAMVTSSDNTSCTLDLVGVGTATIYAYNVGRTLTTQCTITVSDIPVIQEDTLTSAVIAKGGEYAYFKFTPSVSGSYYFESYSDGDTYGTVYYSNMSEIQSNDDSGDGSNFKVEANLVAGTTYFLGARYYGNMVTGSFNVKVYKVPAASSVYFTNGSSYTGYVSDSLDLYVDFLPAGCTAEVCTFETSDSSVVQITDSGDNYCSVKLLAAGSATITATSENGFEAEFTVTSLVPVILTEGVALSLDLSDGSGACASFTPSESGKYMILVTEGTNGNEFEKKVVAGNNEFSIWDAKLIVDLYEGVNYLLKVPSGSYYGSFKLTVFKCVSASGVSFIEDPGYTGYIDTSVTLSANVTPFNAIPESITFASSNDTVASVSYQGTLSGDIPYCTVNLNSPGTATITATSENGLTATYVLTVIPYPTLTLDTPYTFNLQSENAVATFTPSESGQYSFRCSDYSGGYYFYKSLRLGSSTISTTYSNEITANLTAGNTYIFKTNEYYGNFKVTVTKCVAATGITFVTPAGASGRQFTTDLIEAKLVPDNAIDEEITFTSSDDTIAEVYNSYRDSDSGNYVCELRLYKAGTVTITAETQSGLSATYSYTVVGLPALTLDTPYGILSTDYMEGQTVAFTPAEDGLYKFTSTYPCYRELYEGFIYITDSYSDFSVELEAGKTYLLTLRYFTGTSNVTVSKCVPAASLTFDEASYSGLEYRSLFLSTTLAPENAIPEGVTFSSSNTGIAAIEGYGSNGIYSYLDLKLLAPGTVTITATSSDTGLTATCTVTVQAMPVLTLNQKTEFVSTDNNDEHFYKFTPTVSGYYYFNTDEYSSINIEDTEGNYSDYTRGHQLYTYLNAGTTYILNVTEFTGPNSVTVQRAVSATSMSLSESSYLGYEYTYYNLDASFAPDNAIVQDVVYTTTNSNVVAISSQYDGHCELKLLASGTATITATSDSGLTATCEITVLPLDSLTLDTPYTLTASSYGDKNYVKFIPSETAFYYFKTSQSCYTVITENFSNYTSSYETIYCELQAGKTYVIGYSNFTGTVNAVVTKAVPASSLDIEQDTVVAYPFDYAFLTADFGPGDCIPEDVTYTSSAPDVVEINYAYLDNGQSNCTLKLLKPGTATITAVSENGLTDTCTVTVKPLLVLTEDTLTQVQIVNNGTECYSFTPSQSGKYFFRISDYSNMNKAAMYLNDGFTSLVQTNDQPFSINLVGGKTYIFQTRYNDWYTSTGGSGTFNVFVTLAVPATSINLSSNSITGYVGTTKSLSSSFEPWNAVEEGYVYSSSDNNVATVDAYGTVTFVSAGTATITVTSTNGLTDTCTVTAKNYRVLTADVPETAVITGYGELEYFTFTAPESGYYVFYSDTDDYDPYAEMFAADMSHITDDDDGGSNGNFRIKRELTAGETYIFSTGMYSDDVGSYTVVIEKKRVATGIEIMTMPAKTEYVKNYVYQTFDPTGLVLRIHWSDSTTSVYSYDVRNPYLDGLAVGVSPYIYNNGNSARLRVTYDGNTVYGALTLIDSPVDSIELVYNDCLTFVENCDGYRDRSWNPATSSYEYFYHYHISPDDIAVRINYKNGTSVVANVNDYVDGIEIGFTDDQYDNHWTVGASNYFTVNYIDKSVQVPVIITPNGVDSIEVVTPTATTLIENCGGFVSNTWDPATGVSVPYYYYSLWDTDFSDAVIRINYTDGTSTTANFGDYVNGYRVTFVDDQSENHWSLGTNTLTVSYMGATATMNVSVIETPVQLVVVNNAPSYEYYFGDTAHGRSVVSNGVTYYQINNVDLTGLELTVVYKNGQQVRYTDADIGPDGRINGYELISTGFEYPNGQIGLTEPDNRVQFNWSYMGVDFSYARYVFENPFSGIEIISQPDIASSNGNFIVEPYGLKVRILYRSGGSSEVTFTESNTVIHYDGVFGGGGIYYTTNFVYDNILYYRTWTGGEWKYVVEYVGNSAVLSGTPKDVDVTDVSIENFEADCDGMEIDACFSDGTSETLTFTVLREINEFADGTEYIVRTSEGVMQVFIAPLRDANNQIYCYWVEALLPLYYYLNLPIVAGDIDQDGDADLADYDVIRAYISGDNITSSRLSDADINGDGAVDAFDLFELDMLINNTLANKFTYSEIDTASASITAYNGSDAELTLPKYYLSRTITTIGQNAFKGKTSLAEVTLCDTITTLDNYAFMNCSNLESVKFNSGLQSIKYGAFLNCTSLEKIALPNSVTTIGSNAFKGCTSLEYVALSNGITSLSASNIFANCTSLKTVVIPDSVTSINASTFDGCGSQLTIYGKAGSAAETFANAQGINFVAMG